MNRRHKGKTPVLLKLLCRKQSLLIVLWGVLVVGIPFDCQAEPLPPYTIRGVFPGTAPNGFAEVLRTVEAQLKDTLNVTLDFQFMPTVDYRNKITVMMAAGDDFDIHLNAQWMSLYKMIADGSIQPWDKWLKQYGQAVLQSIPDFMLAANKIDGKIYGIPNGNAYGKVTAWQIRKDLREKYGLPKPTTIAELEEYLLTVKAHEPGLAPASWSGGQTLPGEAMMSLNIHHRSIRSGIVETWAYGHADGTIEPFRNLFDDPYILEMTKTFRRWYLNDLIEHDVLIQTDANIFLSGKTAATWTDVTRRDRDNLLLAANVPGAEIELLKLGQGEQKLTTDFQMWNFVVLNAKSKNPARVVQFLNWIFSDQTHYDLLAYGIEGKHWIDTGNMTMDFPAGMDMKTNYNFPGYVLLWKPGFERLLVNASDEQVYWMKFLQDEQNMVTSPLLGFNPDLSMLKGEFAKCNAIWPTVVMPIRNGVVDPDIEIQKAKKKMAAAGYDKIVAELNRQLDAFQSANGLK